MVYVEDGQEAVDYYCEHAGEIDLVTGTQAIVQDDVKFAQLGLAVIDEQHKFGVIQRQKLRQIEALLRDIYRLPTDPSDEEPANEVTRALEETRATKQIGHSLDASVSICAEEEPFELLHSYSDELYYPAGYQDLYTKYSGEGGVTLSSFFRNAA